MNPYYGNQGYYRSFDGVNAGQTGGQLGQSGLGGGYYPAAQQPVSYNYETGYAPMTAAPTGGSGSSKFDFKQITQMIDRLGGIEGVLDKMNKVNKLMANVQQMAPMLKLLMGSIGKKNSSADDDDDVRPRRRRRRRKKTTSRRRKSR